MIPDRAPEHKRHCLTMYAYQVMPMIPKPTNAEQRQVVAKAGPLAAKCHSIPKAAPAKQPPKSKKAINAAELFKGRSLTVNMIQSELGLSVREVAGRKVREWYAQGLIVEDESPVEYTPGRVQKWWRLA